VGFARGGVVEGTVGFAETSEAAVGLCSPPTGGVASDL
jgi:hypothetical protein